MKTTLSILAQEFDIQTCQISYFFFTYKIQKSLFFSVIKLLNKIISVIITNTIHVFHALVHKYLNIYSIYLYYILFVSPLFAFIDLICFLFNIHPEQRRMSKTTVAIANIAKKTYNNVVGTPSLPKKPRTLPDLHLFFTFGFFLKLKIAVSIH